MGFNCVGCVVNRERNFENSDDNRKGIVFYL